MKDKTPNYHGLGLEEMMTGLEVANVGIGTVDYTDDTMLLDELAADIFDLPANTPIARDDLHGRIHPEDWPEVEPHVELLLSPTESDVIDLTHRICQPDGSIRWVNARKKARFEGEGAARKPVSGVFAIVEVTREKRAELQSEFLIGELNHRTKNLLAVVVSIVRQLSRLSSPEDFQKRLIDRLTAMAQNQDALAQGTQRGSDFATLVRTQLRPFEGQVINRVSIDGPPLSLSSKSAMVLSMMLHELITNAVKYGALSNAEGTVALAWTIRDGHELTLTWTEREGPPVVEPESSGFGTQVLTTYIERSFDAEVTLSYPAEGFRARVTAPLDRLAE